LRPDGRVHHGTYWVAWLEKLAKVIAGSQLVTVEHPGSGLFVEVEAEQIAKLILDFLSSP
jgi:hypothetical protein